jgi:simple sugar transport system permease protein
LSKNAPSGPLPRWIELGLLPSVNLLLALVVSGLVVVAIGENPFDALSSLIDGALGSQEGIGYTLYYTTDMVFVGLSVAVAFHCGLFNIGCEGQAYVAGLGVALACLYLDFLPWFIIVPVAMAAGIVFGAIWAAIPGWLQARRGSHIVITTIMFNFISYAMMNYLLVHVLIKRGQMSPESRTFLPHTTLPFVHDALGAIGVEITHTPLNVSIFWAAACLIFVWLFIWHTRWGYAIRVVGTNPSAAVYGGIEPGSRIILAMILSGGLVAGVAINEVMGVQQKLQIGFTEGYGFTGIAVALMGRNHPFGILLASLLFGVLIQGGSSLSFDMPNISREMVVVIQGLVILFTGALESMFRPALARFAARIMARSSAAKTEAA